MSATSNTLKSDLHDLLPIKMDSLVIAIIISLLLHLMLLFGVTFEFPTPNLDRIATSLEVVLVNKKTSAEPIKTTLLAQENLDGGGNTDQDHRAKTPFPVVPKSKPKKTHIAATEKVKRLEQETKKLMTAIKSKQQIIQPAMQPTQTEKKLATTNAAELLQQSLDINRLQAQIAKDYSAYQKRPKRKFVGARTKEYRFARYVEDWRMKIERVGNLNYPEAAKKGKLYGRLQLTVGIRADGSLESIGINRSSGEKILDEAAKYIVRLAGQNGFAPFPPDIKRDTDILHITRTWVFSRSDQLFSQ